ncbi:MAG: GNAT family N-acetyltransferase [Thermodesulfobacteriota bacterium]
MRTDVKLHAAESERITAALRVMTVDDIPEAIRLKEIAGWNQTAADWGRFVSATPEGCFVAEHEGRVIGTTTSIVYEGRFAWIGMVLVEPQFRGQGIGTALFQRAISYLDAQGVPCLKLDATPQGRLLYEKLGFDPEYEIQRWMLKREPNRSTAPREPERIEDVLQLDLEIFGADRSRLLRSVLEEEPLFSLAVRQPAGLLGYAFGRHGARADQLGPWIARDPDVGRKLLLEFLCRSSRDVVCVDCPAPNPWVGPLVRAEGFEFARLLTRMHRGPNAHPGRPELVCGTLGPEFG